MLPIENHREIAHSAGHKTILVVAIGEFARGDYTAHIHERITTIVGDGSPNAGHREIVSGWTRAEFLMLPAINQTVGILPDRFHPVSPRVNRVHLYLLGRVERELARSGTEDGTLNRRIEKPHLPVLPEGRAVGIDR